ncbi:MAG: hypothetical protein K8T25_05905 [Planctomycetia bacterium]|nr:hypothetical protein [Planctomycetia bacterium]
MFGPVKRQRHAADCGSYRKLLGGAAIGLIGLTLSAWTGTSNAATCEQQHQRRSADALVGEALQRQIYGQCTQQNQLLFEALSAAPDCAAAHWQSGQVFAYRKWQPVDASITAAQEDNRLTRYLSQRAQTPITVDGQLRLAAWCRHEGLLDQQRAHLTRVLELNPDQPDARAQLGFTRVGNDWVASTERKQAEADDKTRAASLAAWKPRIEKFARALEATNSKQRSWAAEQIVAIDDPAAVMAIETVLGDLSETAAGLAVQALGKINQPTASLALARLGINSRWASVRKAAAAALKSRPMEQYVPALLAAMSGPVRTHNEIYQGPNGRIIFRHSAEREGQDRTQQQVTVTEYRRQAQPGSDGSEATARMLSDVQRRANASQAAAARQSQQDEQLNGRIMELLATTTERDLVPTPSEWWKWWNAENEVYVPEEKPVQSSYKQERVVIRESIALIGGGTGTGTPTPSLGPSRSADCLAAGTMVWTERGMKSIESIAVGDRVLSQDAESGELAYKPVLRTTIRPAGPLVRIDLPGEYIRTSGGHPFWVAGDGWVKSRQIKSGMLLSCVGGPVQVSLNEQDGFQPTYNLIVADFNTYFVGHNRVLCHDNTIRKPTQAVMPGLAGD